MNTILRNKAVVCVFIIVAALLGSVFAADVIVKDGDLYVVNLDATEEGTFLGGAVSLGEELIDDPYFDDEDCWDETDGWDVNETTGLAVSNGGAGDTLEEDDPFTVKTGTDYLFEIEVVSAGGGGIEVKMGGAEKTLGEKGVHTFTLTTRSTTALEIDTIYGSPVTLTSVSVKESGSVEFGNLDVFDTLYIDNGLDLEGTVILNPATLSLTGPVAPLGFDDVPKDACDVLVVTGGDGGPYAGPASKGSDISLTTGTGGASPSNHGGDAGDVTITTGTGGNGTGLTYSGGDGGDIELTTGAGGTGSSGAANGSYGDVIIAKNGGNVGIGTSSPSAELDVDGDIEVTGTATVGTLILPVKSTTGDPASPVEGQIYVNTFDNKVRVYADGAWRDLATW